MKIFYSETHRKHSPPFEVFDGLGSKDDRVQHSGQNIARCGETSTHAVNASRNRGAARA